MLAADRGWQLGRHARRPGAHGPHPRRAPGHQGRGRRTRSSCCAPVVLDGACGSPACRCRRRPRAARRWASARSASSCPTWRCRSEADERRRDFRRTVGIFLDLVAMNLAGGRGLPEALLAAATVSDHWTLVRIRQALANARLYGTTPWVALGDLGRDIGLEELQDLAGALSLAADDGAKIRSSLSARAATLRRKELTAGRGRGGREVAVDARRPDAHQHRVPGLPGLPGRVPAAVRLSPSTTGHTDHADPTPEREIQMNLHTLLTRLRARQSDERGATRPGVGADRGRRRGGRVGHRRGDLPDHRHQDGDLEACANQPRHRRVQPLTCAHADVAPAHGRRARSDESGASALELSFLAPGLIFLIFLVDPGRAVLLRQDGRDPGGPRRRLAAAAGPDAGRLRRSQRATWSANTEQLRRRGRPRGAAGTRRPPRRYDDASGRVSMDVTGGVITLVPGAQPHVTAHAEGRSSGSSRDGGGP